MIYLVDTLSSLTKISDKISTVHVPLPSFDARQQPDSLVSG